jgi:enamine deaminase RidA (YjgF/YER057c/UK114 family)
VPRRASVSRVEVIHYDPPRSYARASRVGDTVYVAGEVGRDEHGAIVDGGIVPQTRRAFENIRDTLRLLNLRFDDLVKMDVFVLEETDIHPFLDTMREFLPNGSPPGTLLCVKGFSHAGMLVEIACVAAVGPKEEER